jgi:hypothetical protein
MTTMTNIDTLTDTQVEALLSEAAEAGEAELVSDCKHVLRSWTRSVLLAQINEEPVARILSAINDAEAQAS